MILAVTGANGHIGNNLLRALLDKGHAVRAIVHDDTRAIEDLDVERVQADVCDLESLKRAFDGVEVVYHLAGLISIVNYQADLLHDINVLGTRNVVEASLACGVRRVVYTSSIESLLRPDKTDPIDEQGEPRPDGPVTLYGRTKALAELELHEGIRRGLDAVIVHPTAVVGPHDFKPSLFGQVFLDFAHRRLPAFTTGGFDLVDVRDVVAGILAAGERGRKGEHYILSGEHIVIADLGYTLEACTGAPRPRFKIPLWLASLAGVFMPIYYRLTGRRPRFTRMSLKMLADGRKVNRSKAGEELGYTPRSPVDGVKDAVAWYRDKGMIVPVFLSGKDPGIVVSVTIILAVCTLGGLLLLVTGETTNVLLGLGSLALSLLYAWFTMPVRYEIMPEHLLIQGGPYRWCIRYENIQGVRPSKSPLPAPAWSWRRLRVDYQKNGKSLFVLISPKDRQGFLQALAETASNLELAGDKVLKTIPVADSASTLEAERPGASGQ